MIMQNKVDVKNQETDMRIDKEIRPNNKGEFPILPNGLYRVSLGNATSMQILVSRNDGKLTIGVIGKGAWSFNIKERIDKDAYGYVQEKLGLGRYDGDAMHLVDFINCQNYQYSPDNVAGNYSSSYLSDVVESPFDINEFSEEEMERMNEEGYTVVKDANDDYVIEPYGYDFSEEDHDNVVRSVIESAKEGDELAIHACVATKIFEPVKASELHPVAVGMLEEITGTQQGFTYYYEANLPSFLVPSNKTDGASLEEIERRVVDFAEQILSNKENREELAAEVYDISSTLPIRSKIDDIIEENTKLVEKGTGIPKPYLNLKEGCPF